MKRCSKYKKNRPVASMEAEQDAIELVVTGNAKCAHASSSIVTRGGLQWARWSFCSFFASGEHCYTTLDTTQALQSSVSGCGKWLALQSRWACLLYQLTMKSPVQKSLKRFAKQVAFTKSRLKLKGKSLTWNTAKQRVACLKTIHCQYKNILQRLPTLLQGRYWQLEKPTRY